MTYSKLAVIPARGGSTRLKDKNIYPIGGKPLIAYTIEAVLQADCFDTVIVSTDSDKIKAVAKEYDGISIYDRPAEYSGERVTVLKALIAMMDDVERHDIFSYFLPTCPFRTAEDISKGVSLLQPEVDSVISVSPYSEPPQFAMIKHGDDVFPVFDNLTVGATNSKFIQKYYKPNGSFFMSWWDKLKENKNFFVGRVKAVEIPKERTVDIDDINDIQAAEKMIKASKEPEA